MISGRKVKPPLSDSKEATMGIRIAIVQRPEGHPKLLPGKKINTVLKELPFMLHL